MTGPGTECGPDLLFRPVLLHQDARDDNRVHRDKTPEPATGELSAGRSGIQLGFDSYKRRGDSSLRVLHGPRRCGIDPIRYDAPYFARIEAFNVGIHAIDLKAQCDPTLHGRSYLSRLNTSQTYLKFSDQAT